MALQRTLIIASLFGGIMISHTSALECTKFNNLLCSMLKQSTADSDTFSVSIHFPHPAKDTSAYCRSLEPKSDTGEPKWDTDGRCTLSGYDSAYYANLRTYAQTMFAKFELWDARNPTVRLTNSDTAIQGYAGIVATKSTLIQLQNEPYVSVIENWKENFPANILSHSTPKIKAVMKHQGQSYLANGKVTSKVTQVRVPSFR